MEKKDVFVSRGRSHYRIPSIAVLNRGTVLCFANRRMDTVADGANEVHLIMRRSTDGGRNWDPVRDLFAEEGWDAAVGTATIDGFNGTVVVSYGRRPPVDYVDAGVENGTPESGDFMAISRDEGKTWNHEGMIIRADSAGFVGRSHGASPGIALCFGSHHGRLLVPARLQHNLAKNFTPYSINTTPAPFTATITARPGKPAGRCRWGQVRVV